MIKPVCSHCRRLAVWLVLDAPFCEAHKEKVIENWGVDRFPIKRLAEDERFFRVRGRLAPAPKPFSRSALNEPLY